MVMHECRERRSAYSTKTVSLKHQVFFLGKLNSNHSGEILSKVISSCFSLYNLFFERVLQTLYIT